MSNVESKSGESAIANADKWQTIWFSVTVIIGLLAVAAAYMVFRAGNIYQDTVRRDADTRIARINLEVEAAKERAAQAEIKAGEIEKQNLELRLDLESEKRKRGKLEDHIEPRKLWRTPISKERLQKYKGTLYILEYLPDPDALGTANLIDDVLQEAEWNRIGIFPNPYNRQDGVEVATRGWQNTPENFRKPRAASELVSYLSANKWGVMDVRVNIPGYWTMVERNLGEDKIPDDTVKIFVGLKQDWYFGQKFVAELRESRKKDAEREGKPVFDPPWLPEHEVWVRANEKEALEKLRKEWGIFP
jgi:hypothetical protein